MVMSTKKANNTIIFVLDIRLLSNMIIGSPYPLPSSLRRRVKIYRISYSGTLPLISPLLTPPNPHTPPPHTAITQPHNDHFHSHPSVPHPLKPHFLISHFLSPTTLIYLCLLSLAILIAAVLGLTTALWRLKLFAWCSSKVTTHPLTLTLTHTNTPSHTTPSFSQHSLL